jgi:hypothetical protein
MGGILTGVGGLIFVIGWIWILVIAFQNGDVIWGILSLLCGLVGLIYAIQHFEQAKIPLGLLAGGIVLNIVGAAMGGIPMAT